MLNFTASVCVAATLALAQEAQSSAPLEQNAYFQSKTVMIPKDDKIHRGGEDSADSSAQMLAVADGVGGWSLQGINPGLFSRELTR